MFLPRHDFFVSRCLLKETYFQKLFNNTINMFTGQPVFLSKLGYFLMSELL